MLDITFNNPTEQKFLSKAREVFIKGFQLIKAKDNFFIWQSRNGRHYKRLTLIREGWHNNTFFYWNYEPDFKPFSDKENINIRSETFKADETDKFYNYFLNMLDIIKGRV